MQQFLGSLHRNPSLVNLDPANENIPYKCDINIRDLISVERVMEGHGLGPNGALLFCMEELEKNIDWLLQKLDTYDDAYFIFDLPGQVELSTCHYSLINILRLLSKRNFRLAVVHLSDASYCFDPMKYISMLLVTIKSMMQLECPQVNLLSKLDLVESYGPLPMRLEYYANVQDLRYLVANLNDDPIGKLYHRLNSAMCELIEDLGILSFIPFAVEDKDCMTFALAEIDKANGYIFGGLTTGNETLMEVAMSEARRESHLELMTRRYTASE